jgi:predicted MPP superfamily phosphohydrolase
VIVDTGDFMVGLPPVEKVAAAAARLVPNWPPQVRGLTRLAVVGNHDYYAGDDAVAELESALESLGVRVLRNRAACVPRGDVGISFFGLTPEAPGADEVVTMLERAPHPRIVLVHEPDEAERLPPGSADLVLSGHTHGGQIALPGLTRWTVRHFNGSRYVHGMYHINRNRVYVNRGLGCTGLPFRFRAAPELTIIRLLR